MNHQQLQDALRADGGKVVIATGRLTPGIDRLLLDHHDDQPIVISDARVEGTEAGGTITVSGRASFLRRADLPVTARFSLDGAGEVQAAIRYDLIGEMPGPDRWTFADSFPALPAVVNYGAPSDVRRARTPDELFEPLAGQTSYLSALDLFSSSYILSSGELEDEALGVTLAPGINFVGRMRAGGALAVLRQTLGASEPLRLRGTVRIPRLTETTLPLESRQYPWQRRNAPAPGILLESSLGRGGALGGMRLESPRMVIYSPHDRQWLESNRSFEPRIAYLGTLSIPSAGVAVEVAALVKWGLEEALLSGDVEGVSLGKLQSLADAAGGGDDLVAHLPEPLRETVETLGKLSLTHLWVQVSPGSRGLHAGGVGFSIGLPGVRWKIWGDHLAVEDISCDFEISNPFGPPADDGSPASKRGVIAGLRGTVLFEGVPVSVRASNENGFTVHGRLAEARSLPLEKLLSTYAPGIPPPSDLRVDSMSFTVSSGFLSMSVALAGRPDPWVIDLGPGKLEVEDIALQLLRPSSGPTTGSFSGTIAFGKHAVVSAQYSIPGAFVLHSSFPRINLSHLVETLCDRLVELPGGFDLVLEGVSALIQKQGDTYTFRAATGVKGFGLFAFEVRRAAGGWGFAAGMSLGEGRLSQLPGLGGLRSIEAGFKLEKLMLVVSSFEDAGFTFPDMAQFNRPQLATQKLALPSQATGVVPGFMLFAEWELDAGRRELRMLMALLGLGGRQAAAVAIGADPLNSFRLYLSGQGQLQKHPFQYRLGMELSGGNPAFFLTGSLVAKIQGQPQTFDLTTVFVPGGALMSATMKGTAAVRCGPLRLSNLALQIGVSWSGLPSLGIAATLDVKRFQSSIAVFFDSTDPSRSMVAGSVSSLTAKDVMDSLVGGGATTPIAEVLESVAIKGTHELALPGDLSRALDDLECDKVASGFAAAKVTIPSSVEQLSIVTHEKGASWHLTDLTTMRHYELRKKGGEIQATVAPQLYFAPQPTFIGTIKFPQGFYLNAAISFAGFDAEATIEIAENKGFAVDARMDRIALVDEKLFSIAAAEGGGGPKVSISTFSQPDHPEPECRQPHFHLDGALTMLGIRRRVLASVSTKGVRLELKGALVPRADFDVSGLLGKSGLEASGEVKVEVGTIDLGKLGKVKPSTDVTGALEIAIGKEISLELEAGFRLGGQEVRLGRFSLEAEADALTRLPATVAKKVEVALRDLFKDPDGWAAAVEDGAVSGVEDTEAVLKDVYGKSEKEARALAGKTGKTISKGTKKAGKKIGKKIGKKR